MLVFSLIDESMQGADFPGKALNPSMVLYYMTIRKTGDHNELS